MNPKLLAQAALLAAMGMSALCNASADDAEPVKSGHGILCLTFDDSHFADWEAALPIFARHGAHATFFAYHAIDADSVESLRRLSQAGHSIGLHGFRHQGATDAVERLGEDGYFADEIAPQLSAAHAAGLPVRSFAYPMSRHSPQTDALLLKHFDRLRGGWDWDGAFPAAEAATRRYLPGLGVGPRYNRGGREIAEMLPGVAASNAVLVIYSHGIGEKAESVNMSRDDLETILDAAESLGMAVLGFDELGSTAPRHDPNLVAFISDLHVNGMAEGKPGKDCHQAEYLRKTVAEILALDPLPANVICCGDIAFLYGLPQDYALAKTILQPLYDAGIKVTLGMGDHDRRDNFLAVWPEYAESSPVPGRIVSEVALDGLDILLLDTVNDDPIGIGEGTRPGDLGDAQRRWLETRLASAENPVILCGHHAYQEQKGNAKILSTERLLATPLFKGYIHGHHHRWVAGWDRVVGRGLIPRYTLPSTGHWGDIGWCLLRVCGDHAVLELRQSEWFGERGPGSGGAVGEAFVRDRAGQHATIPLH